LTDRKNGKQNGKMGINVEFHVFFISSVLKKLTMSVEGPFPLDQSDVSHKVIYPLQNPLFAEKAW